MNRKKFLGVLLIFSCLLLLLPHSCRGEESAITEVILHSDELYYDPNAGRVTARGSVEVTKEDLIVNAPFAEGFIDGEQFRFWDNVAVSWPSQEATLTCVELKIDRDERGTLFHSFGKSHLIRGQDEEIRSDELEWLQGEIVYYSAVGNVNARMGQMRIIAEKVTRQGESFKAIKVRQFEDKGRDVRVSAQEVSGKITEEQIEELWATGNVVVIHEPSDGERTHITGKQAHYLRGKGVLEVTGDAKAVQEGRTIEAESLIYYVDDRHIEALGRPKVVIEVKED